VTGLPFTPLATARLNLAPRTFRFRLPFEEIPAPAQLDVGVAGQIVAQSAVRLALRPPSGFR